MTDRRTHTSLGPLTLTHSHLFAPEEGLERQVLVWSEQMMLVRHQMRAGWRGVRHSHPHEQMVYVISGRLRFVRGAEVFEVEKGDSFIVPGGIEHEASALEPSEVLDFFVPFREDYAGREGNA
jgi:quercetin dioxygenase-like cupin family protein